MCSCVGARHDLETAPLDEKKRILTSHARKLFANSFFFCFFASGDGVAESAVGDLLGVSLAFNLFSFCIECEPSQY